MRNRAENSNDTPRTIYGDILNQRSNEAIARVGNFDSARQLVQRVRRQNPGQGNVVPDNILLESEYFYRCKICILRPRV